VCNVWLMIQEIRLNIINSEDLGLVISGGAGSQCGNPHDNTDEGIFISEVGSFCLPGKIPLNRGHRRTDVNS